MEPFRDASPRGASSHDGRSKAPVVDPLVEQVASTVARARLTTDLKNDEVEVIARDHLGEAVNLTAPPGTSWNVWPAFREHAHEWWAAGTQQLSLVDDQTEPAARRRREVEEFRAAMREWAARGIPTPATIQVSFNRLETKKSGSRRSSTAVPVARGTTYALSASVGRRAIAFALAGAADAGERWTDEIRNPIVMREGESVAEVVLVRPLAAMKRSLTERERAELAEAHRRWREIDQDVLDLLHNNVVENESDTNGFWFASYDAILDALGRQKKVKSGYSAGHRPEDRDEIHQSVLRLVAMGASVSGIREENGKARLAAAIVTHEYQIVVASGSVTGVWYKLGPWTNVVAETSVVPLQILRYGNTRAHVEARLGRLLAALMAGSPNGMVVAPVNKIIEEIRMPVDETKPGRTRDRFQKALDTLKKDAVIGTWRYDPREDESPFAARAFLGDWLGRRLIVTPALKVLKPT